ncbi:Oidioi.mRNA.OKI2018_I69.XSR.g15795.t2.cds [Oikopleura dioica]|uniref:Oidioi.mRNA.OKI2018_I69.XSR.g15795.t2.cds n=1 Tax=Oikopleura dioica TaxID=34765 RepID=A0ABN7SN93_OIKDI|nr:Oidioi.mRNA.OKI2018_I69.XSR.g15795.t2.cds [Oikopleura dioica]
MSSSESSAFEYRRRLPEVPRTVRFSGDVLNRIDDVADKIESVGSRMRQVENIISDSRVSPQSDQKSELIRLRDDVNRTLAAIDPGTASTHKEHFPTSFPSDGDAIRTNLQRINAKIFEVSSEKENQAKEIADLRQKLAESQIKAKLAEEEERNSMEKKLKEKSDREQFLTQHLSAVSERAETVSGRNYELQREMSDTQAENAKLRKDCQSLIQEIEKLRLEQVEDKRLHNENERVTAQLGRQVAEHRTQSEHLLAETKRLTENLDTAKTQSNNISQQLKQAELIREQLGNENTRIRDELVTTSKKLSVTAESETELKEKVDAARLREVSIRAELDSVRERNGAFETKTVEIQKEAERFKNQAIKNDAENRCLKARISEMEAEITSLQNRLVTSEEHQSQTASQLFTAERKLRETTEHASRVEDTNRTSQQLQHQLEREIVKSREESNSLKDELQSTKEKLSHEQAKNQMLQRDLENLNERLNSDQAMNQRQIQCLREEHARDKKLLDERIVTLSSASAQDVKNAQDANTALRAELKAATDEVKHQTDKAKLARDGLRDAESKLKMTVIELEESKRANETLIAKNRTVKDNCDQFEKELLQSRQDVSKLEILLRRSCAIAKSREESDVPINELPGFIERLQQSNEALLAKTQQVTIELEQSKIKIEKQSRDFSSSRRQLHDELNAAKDEALSFTKKNSQLSVENQELKMKLQGHKDKFETLRSELDRAAMKREILKLDK